MNNYIELFAGIGGMSNGLTNAGWNCVGYVEIDKYAHQSFEILHDPEKKLWSGHDVRDVTNEAIQQFGQMNPIQLLAAGFPCQSFSIAGNRKGFEDKIRGTLFFEVCRFADILKPKWLMLENVKGLLSHDGGETFKIILQSLNEIGYLVDFDVLNTADFGIPQNRERVYIIGRKI